MAFSQNIQRLQPSATIAVSTLAKRLKAEGRDVIDLSAGEPDFDTPGWISEGAIQGIRGGKTRYTPVPGTPQLRQAIARELGRRHGREADWNAVVVSNGAKQSLFNACFCLFGPGDQVLVAAPYWTSHPEIVTLSRAEPVPVFGREEHEFRLTPGDLERAASERTRGLIVCSPSNPSGGVYSFEELKAVAEWARDRSIWLVSDEIYRFICYQGEGAATSILDLPAESLGPFVMVDGVSKALAMTGWRIGFTYSPLELAKKMDALQSHTTSNPSTPAMEAALTAFSDAPRALAEAQRMRESFQRRRDLVTRLFDELLPELPYVRPNGAFYLYFRVDSLFREAVTGSAALCTWILENSGVALVPGIAFGDDRYLRMSYATSDALVEEAIRRLARAVATL